MSAIPTLLLERLKKRGIVTGNNSLTHGKTEPSAETATNDTHAEEVFAESYDTVHDTEKVRNSNRRDAARSQKSKSSDDTRKSRFEPETSVPEPTDTNSAALAAINSSTATDSMTDDQCTHFEVADCPNSSNAYHECVDYCKQRWGLKRFRPATDMLRKRARLLKCYPLPTGWFEVADPSSNRFYYINGETGQVCWLPPSHPHAQITLPYKRRAPDVVIERGKISYRAEPAVAVDIEKNAKSGPRKFAQDSGSESDDASSGNEGGSNSESESDSSESTEDTRAAREAPKAAASSAARRKQQGNGSGRPRLQKDPMDPSSYSECPPGSWTDGLEFGGRKKSAADSTASGSLYEMRPLPTPGAILRMNAESSGTKKQTNSKLKRAK